MTPEFKQLATQWKQKGVRACILVNGAIYRAYEEWLLTNAPTAITADMLRYRMDKSFSNQFGLDASAPAAGVLGWDDFWVKEMTSWDVVASEIEVIHHRAMLTLPQILGLGIDVKDVSSQYKGMGLRMEQDPRVRNMGKIDMATNYKMGTALTNKNFIVNAHRFIPV